MTDATTPLDPQPIRMFDAERLLRLGARLQGAWSFASREEEAACLQGLEGRDLDVLRAELGADPKEEAQELAYQAMETGDPDASRALAQAAIERDSQCLDARTVLAATGSTRPMEQAEALKALLKEAAAEVDPFLLRTWSGRFHSALRLRPHLRLRMTLAEVLVRAQRKRQSIQCLAEMLRLDIPDHLGARYLLAQLYAATAQAKDLQAMVEHFPSDSSLTMAWIRILAKVLAGQTDDARDHLELVRRRNPHVEALLVGKAKRSRHVAADPQPGSLDEACLALPAITPAWTADRAAIYWLAQQS